MDIALLRDEVRAGQRFRAYHEQTGTECTYQVLLELLRGALPGLAGLSIDGSKLDARSRGLWEEPEPHPAVHSHARNEGSPRSRRPPGRR